MGKSRLNSPLGYAMPEQQERPSAVLRPWLIWGDAVGACLSVVAAMAVLWSVRLPLANVQFALAGVLIWLAVPVVWLPAVGWRLMRWCRGRASLVERWPRRLGQWVPPVVALACIFLVRADVPFRVMWAMNRSAMDAWVRQALAGGANWPDEAQVGMYGVRNTEPIPGGVRFWVEGSGFFRSAGGFAYSPQQPPPGDFWDTYAPLRGGWYRWHMVKD